MLNRGAMENKRNYIDLSNSALGIELGSTRIKCVLINQVGESLATGVSEWKNELSEDGYWTYSEDLIWNKIQESYSNLKLNIKDKYSTNSTNFSSMGVSAMMHGFLAFDKDGNLLTPFRTRRNNNTKQASKELSKLFNFNIPERWSIAHLYQSILDNEDFVKKIDYITTLSGYVSWNLTGQKSIGIGDASGMFPIDPHTNSYNQDMIEKFNLLLKDRNINWELEKILPEIKLAGENLGFISKEGLIKIDKTGDLVGDILMAPPEGDAGTGMVATNCISERTANVSIGTSAFSMIVLENELSDYYKDVDIVQTPSGKDVAMIHINNCGSEINEWIKLFKEVLELFGEKRTESEIFQTLFNNSSQSDSTVGNLISYGFHSGENIFDIKKGMPLFVREQENNFNIANLIKSLLISSFIPLKYGHDILNKNENIVVDKILAHGGLFRTEKIAQEIITEVLDAPVSTYKTASEGGAWGMALLALYSQSYRDISLDEFLNKYIFYEIEEVTIDRNPVVKREVDNYYSNYDKYINSVSKFINEN